MKALLQIRSTYRELAGGDAIQAMRTAEALRELGVEADLRGELAPDLTGYDLVHIFNTEVIAEPVRQATRARSWGLPVAYSTIYWDSDPYHAAISGAIAAEDGALRRAERALQRLALGTASLWLPNSRAEADQIAAAFPGLVVPTRIVPNAVERRFAEGDGARFCARFGLEPRGFVFCAGRKEARKNQLGLIRACAKVGLPLVLAGLETAAASNYVAECRALAAKGSAPVLFIDHLDLDSLADAYAAARVHAQPSFYETFGLTSLEAALGGGNIVVTRNSGVPDYLGDDAWYCDPTDTDQMAEAIAAAWAAPLRPAVGQALAARLTWRHVAEETLRGYEEVLTMTERATTHWLPDLTADEYIAQLEETIQLQIEATAFRDRQHDDLQGAHRALYVEFQTLQKLFEEAQRNAADLTTGLAAEAAERRRTEEAFRALEAHVAEQRDYLGKLERELAARPPAQTSRWPRRPR